MALGEMESKRIALRIAHQSKLVRIPPLAFVASIIASFRLSIVARCTDVGSFELQQEAPEAP